jgi:UDP-N-acetylglucosamine diphosphorylase / glucose-1-phosphate thymidylyltransferase / UDP-N-acetylgalactosamine diphosphorylase / glucosamine-1-phosphate N-acetyltransferase / galactosamine-1-phosphate N-acetyltransferase
MNLLFDDSGLSQALYPFTATRQVKDIRVGILTIFQKWQLICARMGKQLPGPVRVKANWIPTLLNAGAILNGQQPADILQITKPWHIFQYNDAAIRSDYQLITAGRQSAPLSPTNRVIAPQNIFIEEGAVVEHAIINAATGPVYIGKSAHVMEGCLIRGPFALGEGAVLKMGAKIYGATSIGPFCIAGGEIKNSVLFGYSNKAHDGYLGDSVIGEWCNLGAGTSNSNIKNTASAVKVWDNEAAQYTDVGIKCGLLMGDYSRSAINTSFNTGTVVGVCCNIFGNNYPDKLVADFTWGSQPYDYNKALQDIENWKMLKGCTLTAEEKQYLQSLFYNKK